MKKRNLGVVVLLSLALLSAILFFNFVFAASQTTSVSPGTGETGVYQIYNITLQNTDTKNITSVSISAPAGIIVVSANTSTNATLGVSGQTLTFTNNSISMIKGGLTGYFWFNATTNQTGTFNVTIASVDNASVQSSTNVSVIFNDTIVPVISFVNQTQDQSINLTSIQVNISASDSGTGLKNVTVYLSNSSGLVGSSPLSPGQIAVNSFFYNFTGLTSGTYHLWATVFDNANNAASTGNFTLAVGGSGSSSCTPNWNYTWGTCNNGTQKQIYSDLNNCGVTTGLPPATNQSCTAGCVTNWACGDWTPAICSSNNGTQTRTCTDSNGCSSPQVETRDCALGSAITTNNSSSQNLGTSALSLSSTFYIILGIIIISVVGVIVVLMRLRKKSFSTDFGSKGPSSGYKTYSPRSPPSGPAGFPSTQQTYPNNFRNQ